MPIRGAAARALAQREQAGQATLANVAQNNYEHGLDQRLAHAHRLIRQVNDDIRPKNTILAYSSKQQEFYDYCEATRGNRAPHAVYVMDANKVYDFMLYVAFRSKRKRGVKPNANKKRNADGDLVVDEEGDDDDTSPPSFNYQEYLEVHGRLASLSDDSGLLAFLPPSPLLYSSFNTYRSALKKLHGDQEHDCSNKLTWAQVWNKKCQDLDQHVLKRKKVVARATHQEKMGSSIEFFMGIEQDKVFEEALWQRGQNASNLRWVMDKIRYVHIACIYCRA